MSDTSESVLFRAGSPGSTESLRPDDDRDHFATKNVRGLLARQLNYQPDALASLWRAVRTTVSPVICAEGSILTGSPISPYLAREGFRSTVAAPASCRRTPSRSMLASLRYNSYHHCFTIK